MMTRILINKRPQRLQKDYDKQKQNKIAFKLREIFFNNVDNYRKNFIIKINTY
jgi:hypothetical protein